MTGLSPCLTFSVLAFSAVAHGCCGARVGLNEDGAGPDQYATITQSGTNRSQDTSFFAKHQWDDGDNPQPGDASSGQDRRRRLWDRRRTTSGWVKERADTCHGDCCRLSPGGPKRGSVNIVFMPSGFHGELDTWKNVARWASQEMKVFAPLNSDKIDVLNLWYIKGGVPNDDGNNCNLGCHGIDRLLCCDVSKFLVQAQHSCGSGFYMNLIIVHNSAKYGGAGYSNGVATMSRHAKAPKIVVHELGHSLFGLADEYTYRGTLSPETYPNCDEDAGCPSWKDMLRVSGRMDGLGWDVGCMPGCEAKKAWVASASVMSMFGRPFGVVNERITCCKYLRLTGTIPEYCDQFDHHGLDLNLFCENGIWGTQQFSALESETNITDDIVAQVTDSQGLENVYMSQPSEWLLRKSTWGRWMCEKVNLDMEPGLYVKAFVEGDVDTKDEKKTIEVEVLNKTGSVVRVLRLRAQERVEIPPDISRDGVWKDGDSAVNNAWMLVVLGRTETCRVKSKSRLWNYSRRRRWRWR